MSACLSVCVTQILLLRFNRFFYTRSIIPVARSTSKLIRIGTSRSTLKNLFTDSSPLGDRNKRCHQSMPRCQTCIMMKTCVMTSHVRHRQRGSVISDCLVIDGNIRGVMWRVILTSQALWQELNCLVSSSIHCSMVGCKEDIRTFNNFFLHVLLTRI